MSSTARLIQRLIQPRITVRQFGVLKAVLHPQLPIACTTGSGRRPTLDDYRQLIEQTVDLKVHNGQMTSGYYEASLFDGLAEIDHEDLIA